MNRDSKLRITLLTAKGYFPEELPPQFNTKDFAEKLDSFFDNWASQHPPSTSAEDFNVPRVGLARRKLSIVNPISQFFLSQLIADEWPTIEKYLLATRISLSTPQLVPDGSRAVSGIQWQSIPVRRLDISARYGFVLETDTSRFYPTLYTHVIPWVLHGKGWCKEHLHSKEYESTLGARLDKLIRKGQLDQTIGIPIGPDTSRIVAELVSVAIDEQLLKIHNIDKQQAVRFVDDWFIGAPNHGKADILLNTLSTVLRDFELELNPDKTRIMPSASVREAIWPIELREFNFQHGRSRLQDRLNVFFTTALKHAESTSEQNILLYAIRKTLDIQIDQEAWPVYESYLLKCGRFAGAALRGVAEAFQRSKTLAIKPDVDKIREFLEDVIRTKASVAHHGEVAWCLAIADALEISLGADVGKAVSQLESSVCAILALHLRSKSLMEGLNEELWEKSLNEAALTSKMWLLAYEKWRHDWSIGGDADYTKKAKFFSDLAEKNVRFFDPTRTIEIRTFKKRTLPGKAVVTAPPEYWQELEDGRGVFDDDSEYPF